MAVCLYYLMPKDEANTHENNDEKKCNTSGRKDNV